MALLKIGLPAPLKFDISLRTTYKKAVWIGFGYRSNDAFTGMLGFCFKDMLRIGYSYDFTTTDLKNYSSGTHELMLGFIFGKSKSDSQSTPSIE